ncbi:hypothetical protein BHM03_00006980 [Ensete ventricosum]|nr:hypothetical protein BHM03_00006980 [Ensete ventricosum]
MTPNFGSLGMATDPCMSTEFFELAIPLTSVSFHNSFQLLCNPSHFARSHPLPKAQLAMSAVKSKDTDIHEHYIEYPFDNFVQGNTIDWGCFRPVTARNRSVTVDFDCLHPLPSGIGYGEKEGEARKKEGQPQTVSPFNDEATTRLLRRRLETSITEELWDDAVDEKIIFSLLLV